MPDLVRVRFKVVHVEQTLSSSFAQARRPYAMVVQGPFP